MKSSWSPLILIDISAKKFDGQGCTLLHWVTFLLPISSWITIFQICVLHHCHTGYLDCCNRRVKLDNSLQIVKLDIFCNLLDWLWQTVILDCFFFLQIVIQGHSFCWR